VDWGGRSGLAVAAALALIVGIGAGLRFAGIDAGTPFVYHPDEWNIVKNAMNMVRDLDPLPHSYTYPSLLVVLVSILVAAIHGLGGPTLDTSQHWLFEREVLPEQFVYFLAARYLVAILGLVTILLVYAIGARLRGRTAGLGAAAVLAVAPLHVENSRFATTDVPVAFGVALALLATLRAVDDGRDRWWIAAGIAAGLAGSTKWNGLAVLGVPLLACLLAGGRSGNVVSFARRRAPWLICLAALITVVVATPGIILEPRIAVSGLLQLRRQYGSVDPASDVHSVAVAAGSLAAGLGPLILVIAVGGLALILAARRPTELPIAAFAAGYFAIVALTPRQFDRNLLPLLPYLALAASLGLTAAAGWTARRLAAGSPTPDPHHRLPGALLAGGVLAVALLPATVRQVAAAVQPQPPDTRTLAVEWVGSHIAAGASIVREVYTPQIGPEYRARAIFYLADQSLADYRRLGVQYLIASEAAYQRYLVPGASSPAAAFYAQLFELPEVGRIDSGPGRQGPLIRIFELAPA
jgi:hypothetical protein